MARYSIWALGESHVSVSGGGQLDGVTQGDGSHLMGLSLTLNSNSWEELDFRDRGDRDFDDNDSDQRLRGNQTFDGTSYGNNTVVEAEYELVLQDPATGLTYRVLAVNFNTSSPSYGTIEGLAFIDEFPPIGVALTVISTSEGPSGGGAVDEGEIAAPPCFTPGTFVQMQRGQKRVEDIEVGDKVRTLDSGVQTVRWVGRVEVPLALMARKPEYRPVRIRKGAFGGNVPERDMLVSPQHRILLCGWRAELFCGETQVLAAAVHLVDDCCIFVAHDVQAISYIHLQFDRHEILVSDGLPSESFNPGHLSVGAFSDASRAELLSLFPNLDTRSGRANAARPLAYRREVQAMVSAQRRSKRLG